MLKYFANIILASTLLLVWPVIADDTTNDETRVNLKIDVPYIELLSGPSAGYPVVHVIEKNELVTVLVKRTSWIKVKDKRGIEGWFHQDALLGLSQQGEAITQAQITKDDFQNRDIEIGVMVGDLEGANLYNLHLGYAFSQVFNAEISAGKALGTISDSDLFEVMLIAHPRPDWTVVPYLGIGGGVINTTPHSVIADPQQRQSTLMSAAAGIKYHLARNFLVRAEYKLSLALTDRDENEEIQTWKIGFSVFF